MRTWHGRRFPGAQLCLGSSFPAPCAQSVFPRTGPLIPAPPEQQPRAGAGDGSHGDRRGKRCHSHSWHDLLAKPALPARTPQLSCRSSSRVSLSVSSEPSRLEMFQNRAEVTPCSGCSCSSRLDQVPAVLPLQPDALFDLLTLAVPPPAPSRTRR